MHQPYNQPIELLPRVFGKCLGLERIDPESIKIRTPKNIPQREGNEEGILAYAIANLPLSGRLKMNDQGFIYLDLSDSYIHELASFLDTPGISSPPYFNSLCNAGAHVTVVTTFETPIPLPPEELNKEISFQITGCYSVEPINWVEMESVWFLTIEAPKLSELRIKLGLSPKINDHEFHITFAVKKRFFSIHDLLGAAKESIFIKTL